jgi:hypothetical protein
MPVLQAGACMSYRLLLGGKRLAHRGQLIREWLGYHSVQLHGRIPGRAEVAQQMNLRAVHFPIGGAPYRQAVRLIDLAGNHQPATFPLHESGRRALFAKALLMVTRSLFHLLTLFLC